MNKKGYGFNLSAGILDVLFGIVIIGFGFLGGLIIMIFNDLFLAIVEHFDPAADLAIQTRFFIYMAVGVFVVLGIMFVIFGAITIKSCKSDPIKYKKRQPIFLSFAIVSTIVLGVILYLLLTELADEVSNDSLYTIGTVSVVSLVTIFRWIGFIRMTKMDVTQDKPINENKGIISGYNNLPIGDTTIQQNDKVAEQRSTGVVQNTNNNQVNNQYDAVNNEPQKISRDEFLIKLERLAKLKEMGAISEEEFNAKKQEIIDKI